MLFPMVLENADIIMETSSTASLKIICAKEREDTWKTMGLFTMATSSMDKLVVLESILAQMAIVTKDLGRQICQTEVERLATEMDQYMRVIWCRENGTEEEDFYKMAAYMRESSKTIRLKEWRLWFPKEERLTRESGSKISSMDTASILGLMEIDTSEIIREEGEAAMESWAIQTETAILATGETEWKTDRGPLLLIIWFRLVGGCAANMLKAWCLNDLKGPINIIINLDLWNRCLAICQPPIQSCALSRLYFLDLRRKKAMCFSSTFEGKSDIQSETISWASCLHVNHHLH